MKAAHDGHPDLATLLLENGADRERASSSGQKAVDYTSNDEIKYILRSTVPLCRSRKPDPEKPEEPQPGDLKTGAEESRTTKMNSARSRNSAPAATAHAHSIADAASVSASASA